VFVLNERQEFGAIGDQGHVHLKRVANRMEKNSVPIRQLDHLGQHSGPKADTP
jgi:hypothetical protein